MNRPDVQVITLHTRDQLTSERKIVAWWHWVERWPSSVFPSNKCYHHQASRKFRVLRFSTYHSQTWQLTCFYCAYSLSVDRLSLTWLTSSLKILWKALLQRRAHFFPLCLFIWFSVIHLFAMFAEHCARKHALSEMRKSRRALWVNTWNAVSISKHLGRNLLEYMTIVEIQNLHSLSKANDSTPRRYASHWKTTPPNQFCQHKIFQWILGRFVLIKINVLQSNIYQVYTGTEL